MIKFCQPSDYRFRGRNVWFKPENVVSITTNDSLGFHECIVKLENGDEFTIAMNRDDAANEINKALAATQPEIKQ